MFLLHLIFVSCLHSVLENQHFRLPTCCTRKRYYGSVTFTLVVLNLCLVLFVLQELFSVHSCKNSHMHSKLSSAVSNKSIY